MKEFILNNGGLMATVALVVVCLNILLTSVKVVLEKVKDLTPTDVDNKAYDALSKVMGVLSLIVDWASANKEHK